MADTWVYHLLPGQFSRLLKMYFRNGRGSGYAARHYPERVLELSDGFDGGEFVERRSFLYRLTRRFSGLFGHLLRWKWIVLGTDLAYGLGVVWERWVPSPVDHIPRVKKIEESILSDDYPWVKVHSVKLDIPS